MIKGLSCAIDCAIYTIFGILSFFIDKFYNAFHVGSVRIKSVEIKTGSRFRNLRPLHLLVAQNCINGV